MTTDGDPMEAGPVSALLDPQEENLAVGLTVRAALVRVQAWSEEGRYEHAIQEAYRARLLITGVRALDPALSDLLQLTLRGIEYLQQQIAARAAASQEPTQEEAPPKFVPVPIPARGLVASLIEMPVRIKVFAVLLVLLVGALVGGALRGYVIALKCRADIAQCIAVSEEALATARQGVTLLQYRKLLRESVVPAVQNLGKSVSATTLPGAGRPDHLALKELGMGVDLMAEALQKWEARAELNESSPTETLSAQTSTEDVTLTEIQQLWIDAQTHLTTARKTLAGG